MNRIEALRTAIAAALTTCTDTVPAALPYRAAVERWLAGEPAEATLQGLPHPDDLRNEEGFSIDPVLILFNACSDDDDDAYTWLPTIRDIQRSADARGLPWGQYVRLTRTNPETVAEACGVKWGKEMVDNGERAADWQDTDQSAIDLENCDFAALHDDLRAAGYNDPKARDDWQSLVSTCCRAAAKYVKEHGET